MLDRAKRLNEVYEYLHQYYSIHTKGEFADNIKYARAYISSALNGNEKYLTDNLFENICKAFPGIFNINYLLTGQGQLLIENVESNGTERQSNHIDHSSLINALLAAKDEAIESLKRELATKNDVIKAKDNIISNLEKLAEERLHRIAELRRVIDAQDVSTSNYPFPIGAADKIHKNI